MNEKKFGRAAVYDSPNSPFRICEFPLRDVTTNEALVKITMATICRSDIHSYLGHRPNPCPGLLGHEIIGTIEKLGSSLTKDLRGEPIALGDRITWTEYYYEGQSFYRDVHDMPQKSSGLRKYGHESALTEPHFLGGFAEYCYILPGTGILKLPDSITDEEAAPLNCGVATMIAVTEASEIDIGDTVVIQGLGLLGLYGCAIAKARGARLVVGLDTVESRLSIAKRFGADFILNINELSEDGCINAVKDLCSTDGADVVIEVCGSAGAVPTGIKMLRTGGRYTIGGLVNPNANFTLDGNHILKHWLTIRGIHNYHPRHLIKALDFVTENRVRFPFSEIVDAKFSLDQINEAFKKAEERSVLRAAIVP